MNLDENQAGYLRSLVRMEIRRRRRRLSSFAPHPGQSPAEADEMRAGMQGKLTWIEGVYLALDGDLAGMRPHGLRPGEES
jgi:hypothetical protein